MLKSKREANYRRAVRLKDGDRVNCGHCALRQFVEFRDVDMALHVAMALRMGWRCKPIGIKASHRYTVHANNVCDHFKPQPASE